MPTESLDLTEFIPAQSSTKCTHRDLVAVRMHDGTVVKGFISWQVAGDGPTPIPVLPSVLSVCDEANVAIARVKLADVKAVFFVRSHVGDLHYDEVKFFHQRTPSDLWVKVSLTDGEVLEGRVINAVHLLANPGFWLWPADSITNNRLIYVPKTSIAEFSVMGFASGRAGAEA